MIYMTVAYILFLLAGIAATNGVPHFVKGITGEKHMTPFGRPSGALVNVLWGSFNFLVATLLFLGAVNSRYATGPAIAAFFVGILLTGILLASLWEDDPIARGQEYPKR